MVTKYVTIPPDGGWGWVIVAASFFCNLVVDGIIFSFGIFITDIAEEFQESKASTALVGSLLSGFYLIAGPFVSALANKFGFRLATILGGILGGIGFAISYFATSVTFLYISYGIIGGVGFGLIYVPAVIAVGFYFERWRALATGIAVCGSGIGTFLMAPFASYLIETLTWRGAMLVQAGIIVSCAVVGLLFRPLEPTLVEEEEEEGELPEKRELNDNQMPLIARNLNGIATDVDMRKSASFASIPENARLAIKEKRLSAYSQHSCPPDAIKNGSAGSNLDIPSDGYLAIPDLNPVAEEGINGHSELKVLTSSSSRLHQNLSRHNSAMMKMPGSRRASRVRTASECSIRSNKKPESRPMQRDDAYFTGSMQRLPQYISQGSLAYHASVTRLPQTTDMEEGDPNEIIHEEGCCNPIQSALSTMLDFSLLTSPTFILLCVSGFLTMMGFFVPFMYLKDRAESGGMTSEMAVWLVSSIGITNTVGRVACGLISSMPSISALLVNNVALTIGGIATIASGISLSTSYQFFYSFVFGLAIACFASLRSILLVDFLGLEKLTNAFGLLLLFQGIAATIGAPIAGAFKDYTGSYDASFYLSGGLILISGIMCYPLQIVHNWENNRKKNNA